MPGALGCISGVSGFVSTGSNSIFPSTPSSISGVIAPGRSSAGTLPVRSTMVDSSPTATAPPSRIMSIFPPRSSATWRAEVGLGRPEVFAEGAAIGSPAARIRALAFGSSGSRIATVSSPPLVSRGTASLFGKIMVSGPGQKAAASRRALSGMFRTSGSISSTRAMWTISGLSLGRPFAA